MSHTSRNGFTPTQKRIMDLLSDGLPHKRSEIIEKCLEDLSQPKAVSRQVGSMRPHLEPNGETIIAQLIGRTVHYRWVRLTGSAYDGRR